MSQPTGAARNFWLRGPGLMFLVVGAGLTVLAVLALAGTFGRPAAAEDIKVTITSCEDSPLGATVDMDVVNTGKRAVTATIGIEYRDEAGKRVDTDETIVKEIAAGDTVRTSEATILDASPAKLSCEAKVTSVR